MNRERWGVSFWGVVRSEWLKLRTLRSSWYALGAAALVFATVGILFGARLGGYFGEVPGAFLLRFLNAQADVAMSGINLAQLITGVFGVLLITGDYATGMIRTTLAAVPRRLPVLWAKLIALVTAALPTLIITCLITFICAQPLLANGPIGAGSLDDPGALRTVLCTALYLTGIAVLGLALGAILRSTAGAITALVALLFVLPGVLFLTLPESWRDPVTRLLPTEAGDAFASLSPDPNELSMLMGAIVFSAWIIISVIIAAVLLKRRAA